MLSSSQSRKPFVFLVVTLVFVIILVGVVKQSSISQKFAADPLKRAQSEGGLREWRAGGETNTPHPQTTDEVELDAQGRVKDPSPFFTLRHNTKVQEVKDKIKPNKVIDSANVQPTTSGVNVAANRNADMRVTDATMPTFRFSKDLFVRAVYFDDRPRDHHQNTSVFLVVCHRNITAKKLIVGCQVGDKKARDYDVKLIGETPLWRAFYDYINHEEALVHCYDLPVRNGSAAYIIYKKTPTSEVAIAASERPLVIPAPRIPPTSSEGRKYDMTVVSCAKIFDYPPWMKEWLAYQKTLGVDHVHLDVENSFQQNGGLSKPYMVKAIKEGFLSVDVWTRHLSGGEIWYHNQGLIYEDCPYRFRGTYDYIIMLDTDDFFTPRDPNHKQIHYYIDKYCRGGKIGSCKFKWVEYFPDMYGRTNVSISDGNVTKSLKSYTHFVQGNPKSLHRTTVLIDTATHYAYQMMPGYRIAEVSVNIAYVAHVRHRNQHPAGGVVTGLPNACLNHPLSKLLLSLLLAPVFFYLL